jgi:hypothetical protein
MVIDNTIKKSNRSFNIKTSKLTIPFRKNNQRPILQKKNNKSIILNKKNPNSINFNFKTYHPRITKEPNQSESYKKNKEIVSKLLL